ncbi:hypothetical protein [Streptomyces parvus]|uniref:hypothetical protein n=1 Tax=Streptomyces parvus TaxID=66428 RepID=UPI0038038676
MSLRDWGAARGLHLSWSLDLPTGGTIVLVSTMLFLLSWGLAPRHGAVARLGQRRLGRTGSGAPSDEAREEDGRVPSGSALDAGTG